MNETPNDNDKAMAYYRAALSNNRPDFVPARVRLPARVTGDGIYRSTFAEAGEHDCESNQWGAISVKATNGKLLGVKPSEFGVIAWKPNDK